MSFNRLDYDTCAYKQEIAESSGPGDYQLNTPFISCEDCFNKDEIFISFVLLGIVAIDPSFRNSEAKSGFVEELKTSLIFAI